MVLGNARLHEIMDNSNSLDKCDGSMSDRHTIPAFLQLPSGLCQVSGEALSELIMEITANILLVLAALDDISVLWTAFPRPRLSCILLTTILQTP